MAARASLLPGLFLLATLGGSGLVAGSAVRAVFSQERAVEAVCEDDECELGIGCVDNAGGNTGCNVDSSGGCRTYGCTGVRN